MSDALHIESRMMKVDESMGLVIGYAVICKVSGGDYYDTQGDHVTEDAMVEAACDFMLKSRASTDMHARTPGPDGKPEVVRDGDVVFCFPLTTEIAKALDIKAERTGLLVGIKPSPEVLAKVKSGEYKGFSIGGAYLKGGTEVIEAAP